MESTTKTRAVAGLAAVVSGVMLIGTTGLTFAFGWAIWAVGLAALMTAVPTIGGDERRRPGTVTPLPSRVGTERQAA